MSYFKGRRTKSDPALTIEAIHDSDAPSEVEMEYEECGDVIDLALAKLKATTERAQGQMREVVTELRSTARASRGFRAPSPGSVDHLPEAAEG